MGDRPLEPVDQSHGHSLEWATLGPQAEDVVKDSLAPTMASTCTVGWVHRSGHQLLVFECNIRVSGLPPGPRRKEVV